MKYPFMVFVSGKGLATNLGDLRKMGILPFVQHVNIFPDESFSEEDWRPLNEVNIETTADINEMDYLGLTGDKSVHFLSPKILTPQK